MWLLVIIVILTTAQTALSKTTDDPPDFQKACDAIKRHDCSHAEELLKKMAQKGHAKSEVLLGLLYEKGAGVKKDLEKSEGCFKKAAAQGEIEGQALLGMLILKGPKVQKRHDEAVRWLHLAADRGSDNARRALEGLPGAAGIGNAMAARRQQIPRQKTTNVVKGVADIKTSWKGYGALAIRWTK